MTKKDALHTTMKVKKWYKETKKEIPSFEEFAAESIMADVMDRRDIKNIFAEIFNKDKACYNDIKKTWEYIIRECFDNFVKNEANVS